MNVNDEERSRAYAIGKILELFGQSITEKIFWLCNSLRHKARYLAEKPDWTEEGCAFDVLARCPHGVPSRVVYHFNRRVDDEGIPCRACDERVLADARMLFDTLPDAQRSIWIAELRRQAETRRREHASAAEEKYGFRAEQWIDHLAVVAEVEAWAERVALPYVPPPALSSDLYVCIERPHMATRKIRADALSRAHLVRWKDELGGIHQIARGSYSYNDGANVMTMRPEQIYTGLCTGDGVQWSPEQQVDVVEIKWVVSTRPDGTLTMRDVAGCEHIDWKFPKDDVCRMVVLEHGEIVPDKSLRTQGEDY